VAGYRILTKPSTVREIDALPKKERQRIVRKIQSLADEPRPRGCEKLSGEDKYRIRQGDYRIVYSISDRDLTVIVVKVAHRREVYRHG
jgi:mRNA interferase RelE/StbE